MSYGSSNSAKIVLSKSIFYVKNWMNFFKKSSFKNSNLGDHFLYKTFFVTSFFEPLYFLKSCPIFHNNSALPRTKMTEHQLWWTVLQAPPQVLRTSLRSSLFLGPLWTAIKTWGWDTSPEKWKTHLSKKKDWKFFQTRRLHKISYMRHHNPLLNTNCS